MSSRSPQVQAQESGQPSDVFQWNDPSQYSSDWLGIPLGDEEKGEGDSCRAVPFSTAADDIRPSDDVFEWDDPSYQFIDWLGVPFFDEEIEKGEGDSCRAVPSSSTAAADDDDIRHHMKTDWLTVLRKIQTVKAAIEAVKNNALGGVYYVQGIRLVFDGLKKEARKAAEAFNALATMGGLLGRLFESSRAKVEDVARSFSVLETKSEYRSEDIQKLRKLIGEAGVALKFLRKATAELADIDKNDKDKHEDTPSTLVLMRVAQDRLGGLILRVCHACRAIHEYAILCQRVALENELDDAVLDLDASLTPHAGNKGKTKKMLTETETGEQTPAVAQTETESTALAGPEYPSPFGGDEFALVFTRTTRVHQKRAPSSISSKPLMYCDSSTQSRFMRVYFPEIEMRKGEPSGSGANLEAQETDAVGDE